MFTITGGKGFQITFENGYTVSVQFGVSSQCSNEWDSKKNTPEELFQRIKDESNGKAEPESATAETALKSPSGSFVRYGESAEYDDVQSYMTPAQVLELLNYAAQLPNPEVDDLLDEENPLEAATDAFIKHELEKKEEEK